MDDKQSTEHAPSIYFEKERDEIMIQRYQLDEFKKEFLNDRKVLDQEEIKRKTLREFALSDKTKREESFDSNYSELSYMNYRVDKSFENPKSGLYKDLLDYQKVEISQVNDTRPVSLQNSSIMPRLSKVTAQRPSIMKDIVRQSIRHSMKRRSTVWPKS